MSATRCTASMSFNCRPARSGPCTASTSWHRDSCSSGICGTPLHRLGQTAFHITSEILMTIEHIETAIIGAGQAGLATAYHLQQLGRPCLILDSNERVGDNWRAQWDSLRLYTPAQYDGLPGLPFPSPRWSYPTKDQVADYLATYAKRFELPVRTLAKVDRLQAVDRKYLLRLGADRIIADNVVVATGGFGRTPRIPDFALDLDPSIRQLHSSEYRRPAQLKPGRVLVVGAGHSGTDIAYEVAATHPTVLAGRDLGQVPVRLDSWTTRLVFPVIVFLNTHVVTRRTPMGRKALK